MHLRICAAIWLACATSVLAAIPTSPTTLPHGLGVNIHFTTPQPGEMEQLAAAGFTFIRMDFSWARTEKKPGEYDFSAYETLLQALEPHKIRALFILDYANPHYDKNHPPYTDAGRKAFAKWAAAGVAKFKGRSVLWELWNEPNITQFWRPKPSSDDYVKLAIEVGKAIREVAPDEAFIGPATSGIDLPFLESCFKGGLLEYFDAVSVHPYRPRPPETAAEDYQQLRLLIARHAPRGKSIPIYSGEWGYSDVWSGFDEAKQALYLPRQWLTNISNDVPLSIWYDWRNDGEDPKEPEHHFGTVFHDFKPKPAYLAAKKLNTELAGFTFNKRLWLGRDDDYVLLFTRGGDAKLAAWTTSPEPREVVIPGILSAKLSGEVQYLALKKSAALTKLIEWPREPLDTIVHAPTRDFGRRSGDPNSQMFMEQPITRGVESIPLEFPSPISDKIKQKTVVVVANPIKVTLRRSQDQRLLVAMENPSGEAFAGTIRSVTDRRIQSPIRLAAGEREKSVPLPLPFRTPELRTAVEIFDDAGKLIVRTPTWRLVSIPMVFDDYALRAEGDPKVKSSQSAEAIPDDPDALQITYKFDAGWKYAALKPTNRFSEALDGKPTEVGMWIVGDGSGNILRLRFRDETGQTFQTDGPKLTWRDYRYVTFALDGARGANWGGAKDGIVHYPIRLETLLLIDSADKEATSGSVKIEAPTLIYRDSR